MTRQNNARFLGAIPLFVIALGFQILNASPAAQAQKAHPAQKVKSQEPASTVPALLVSDIHFEPFWDPEKAPKLAAAPASEWESILASPASADREARFAALEQTCHARGEDASWPLFQSAMRTMRAAAGGAKFVAVSGDLISHSFSCKFKASLPGSTSAAYRDFVGKTIQFVIGEVNGIIAGAPVYTTLGNNDSDCGDYRLDAHSDFLAATGRLITQNFSPASRDAALGSFAAEGDYSVPLPAPIANGRLIVLNDIFLSKRYSTCSGKPDPQAAADEIAWLRGQLAEARAAGQKVWVMGHIPPGIDAYSSFDSLANPCGSDSPVSFLSTEALTQALTDASDMIALALFGHTHMDEIHLLEPEPAAQAASASPAALTPRSGPVAVKLVPSISPIDGNKPSFTVAQVDTITAEIVDYRVIAAADASGAGVWSEEYDYAKSYHETAFNAAAVSQLISGFASDTAASRNISQDYIRNYLAGRELGGQTSIPGPVWTAFVCTLDHQSAEAFKSCACSKR
jgi:sphingomyelin phosphodiesterase acid-like 3